MFAWLSIFTEFQTWIELITLIFLEMALGIDNLVFIVITSDRLPQHRQHIGRKVGLAGALCMRVLLLCCITWIMSFTNPLFTLPFLPGTAAEISVRDLILLVGGVYLMYKGVVELRDMFLLREERAEQGHTDVARKMIGLPQAVVTIMAMDVVFSLDSVITAVGLVGDLPIMIIAVILAVLVMMIFIDPISTFINKHPEIKILALVFIFVIGALLACECFAIEIPKGAVYFAMFFALALDLLQMRYNKKLAQLRAEYTLGKNEREAEGSIIDDEEAEGID